MKMKRGRVSSEDGERVDYSENKTRGLRRMQICKERSDRNPFCDSAAKIRGIFHSPRVSCHLYCRGWHMTVITFHSIVLKCLKGSDLMREPISFNAKMVKMNSTSSNKCFQITFEGKTGIYGTDWSAHTRLCMWRPTLTRTMSASDDINPLVQSWEPEHDFPLDIVSLPSRVATSCPCTTFDTTIRAEQSQNGLSYSDICWLLAGIDGTCGWFSLSL